MDPKSNDRYQIILVTPLATVLVACRVRDTFPPSPFSPHRRYLDLSFELLLSLLEPESEPLLTKQNFGRRG